MLQGIRDRATGLLAWIIVILIAIPFALWGIQQYFSGGQEAVVATVNGRDIKLTELDRAYQQQRERFASLLAAGVDEKAIKRQLLDGIITRLLLIQTAQKMGLRVPDTQLAAQIQSQPAFQQAGHFDREAYDRVLRYQGLSPATFEAELRQGMLLGQMEQGVQATRGVPPGVVDRVLRLRDQEREFSHLVIPVSRFMDGVKVSDRQVSEYYDAHKNELMTPEQVDLSYVELKLSDLAAAVPAPSDAVLRKMYEDAKADFSVEEQRRARHILITLPQDASKAAVDAAREKAEKLLERVQHGEDMARLAQEYSEDPGSAKRGGDLGYAGKAGTDPALEQAVFSMKPGEVRLVRSSFGYHVVRLEDIRPASVKPFADVRSQLLAEYRRREAERGFGEKGEKLADLVYEHPESLEAASKELGLAIKTTGFFARGGGTGIAGDQKVQEAAFSKDVLKDGYNSQPIEISSDDLVVIRVREHKAAAVRPLPEVRAEIEQRLRFQGAKERAKELGAKLLAGLRTGTDAAVLAREQGTEWSAPAMVKRDDRTLNPLLLRTAFSMPRPAGQGAAYGSVVFPTGDYVLIRLTAVREGEPSKVDPKVRSETAKAFERQLGAEDLGAWVETLRQRADVTVHSDVL
jgi:peptidyl-prolyl cis-trans isomerase D